MKDTMKELKTVMIKRRRIDLVAGIVLAGAFRNAMTSLINDVILPPVSTFLTGTNLPNLSYVIKKPAAGMPPVAIGYGRFLQTTVDFLVIGATVVTVLRVVEKMTEKSDVARAKVPSREEKLLTEIRDLMQNQAKA
jgi:large conductance mechanosensitive channel